ncbi:MAG TPA: hypothetical protein VHO03_11175 [Ignavibacteriales bacterium]|nr:hypothetical protein [Ignavibacteriales bacterium]
MWKNITIVVLLAIIAAGAIYLYSLQTRDIKKPPMDGEIVMEDSLFLRPEFRQFLDKYIEAMNQHGHYARIVMIYANGQYLSPSDDYQIEQSFVITNAMYRHSVLPRKPIGYFRYRSYLFLICSSIYSMLADRNGIMKKIEKDLKDLWPGEYSLYDPDTWDVKIKIRGKKVKVEYGPYVLPERSNSPFPIG